MDEHSFIVDKEHDHLRVDVFLTKHLPTKTSRSLIQKLITAGHVKINNVVSKAKQKVATGDTVTAILDLPELEEPAAENIPLDIFYEDEDLIVVNKPSGLTVHPAPGHFTGTLVNALVYHFKNLSNVNHRLRPGIVHRLDMETSGLLVVAKNNETHVELARQFEERLVSKRYAALVEGIIEFDEGMIDAAIARHPRQRDKKYVAFYETNAKEAKTFYRVLKRFKNSTLVALFPRTGRTHQLRVHMAHLGHSILGDDKYGKKTSFPRLALHAQSLGFIHPTTQQYIEFSACVPPSFYKDPAELQFKTKK